MPFNWQAPPSLDPNGTIGSLMLRGPEAIAQGQIEAARARAAATANSGQIWGNAIAGAGQQIAAIPQQMQQQKSQQQEQQLRQIALNEAKQRYAGGQTVDTMMRGDGLQPGDEGPHQPNPYLTDEGLFDIAKINAKLSESGMGHLAPELTKPAEAINESLLKYKGLQQQTADRHTLLIGDLANGVSKMVAAGTPIEQAIQFVTQPAVGAKILKPEEVDAITKQLQTLPPEQQQAALNQLMDAAAKLDKGDTLAEGAVHKDRYGRTESSNPKPKTPGQGDYTINGQRFSADGTAIGTVQPAQTAAKGLEAKSVLLDGHPAEVTFNPSDGRYRNAAGEDVSSRVKPIPQDSTQNNPQALTDVAETVKGMKDGTLPPMMPGRATKEYLATMAEAHRQGYDLQAAVTDWNATQKHIATMNGAQQLRLNQSINALPELLDTVDELASKWKGGKFPILNKANLALAKGGTYGSEAASIANKLDEQIADVTADLGNVYMGGNSPTDHALGLAAKSLSGSWDEKVLHDMVDMARKNVTIRQNSIRNTGVAGASPNNPYVPPSAPTGAPKSDESIQQRLKRLAGG